MAWTRINHFKSLVDINDEYNDPETLKPPTKSTHFNEWMETFEEHLREVRGVRKIPLSYVIRPETVPGTIIAFPANHDLPYSSNYNSFQDELIARATHDHPTFQTDNEAVYHIIMSALNDTMYATSIKRHRSRKNGRGAYLDLVLHHLGTTKWNDLAAASDKRATTLVWNGRSHRYTIDKHINNLRSCHNDLLRCSDHIEYAIPTEPQRVERLIHSIQTSDANIISCLTTIKSSNDPVTGLYTDFERAADFILRIAPKSSKNPRDLNISGIQQDYDNIDKPMTKGPKTGVDLRYHTVKEYRKLSDEEKQELRELRPPNDDSKGRVKQGKKKGGNFKKKRNNKHTGYTRKLERRIAALEKETQNDDTGIQKDDDDQSRHGKNSGSSKTNPALVPPTQRRH